MPQKTVEIYTDGACSGNPGPGGWCAILRYKQHERVVSGAEPDTTNNRMELRAAIEGLRLLREPCTVELYSDSQYLVSAVNERWLPAWQKRGWKKKDGSAVLNRDLWEALVELFAQHEVHLHHVRGHADNPMNNRCDEIAVQERMKLSGR